MATSNFYYKTVHESYITGINTSLHLARSKHDLPYMEMLVCVVYFKKQVIAEKIWASQIAIPCSGIVNKEVATSVLSPN